MRKTMKSGTVIIALAVFMLLIPDYMLAQLGNVPFYRPPANYPKNIILIVGEGMGMNEIEGAAAVQKGNLAMANLPVAGYIEPWNAHSPLIAGNDYINALATGHSYQEDKEHFKNLFTLAKKERFAGAMILTGSPTDDLPSAIFVDQYQKHNTEQRALAVYNDSLALIFAAGKSYFTERADKKNLLDSLFQKGYDITKSRKNPGKNSGNKVVGLFRDKDLATLGKRGDYLTNGALNAVRLLSDNVFGYFLLIDNNQILRFDTTYKNNLLYAGYETADLDKMIAALFQRLKNSNTLILIIGTPSPGTAALQSVNIEKATATGKRIGDKPSAAMIPLFASGPGSESFRGAYSIDQFYLKLAKIINTR